MECSPFFGRQLIQRLVTSNPSPAYVGRGAAAVANNGSGGCGNMQAVIHAVLLDREALAPAGSSLRTGKLREPLVRLGNWMRAFDAKDAVLQHRIDSLSDPLSGLGLNIGSGYLFGTTQGETALRDIISTVGDDMMHEEHVATVQRAISSQNVLSGAMLTAGAGGVLPNIGNCSRSDLGFLAAT